MPAVYLDAVEPRLLCAPRPLGKLLHKLLNIPQVRHFNLRWSLHAG